MTRPTPVTPIEAGPDGVGERLGGPRVGVPATLLAELSGLGIEVRVDEATRAEASRDWWPLAVSWASRGMVPARAGAVVRPRTAGQVAEVLSRCSAARVPVTPAAGRSGVCGGAVPLFGGVALDTTALLGEIEVDEASLVVQAPVGIFGPDLESDLRRTGVGYTLGHWPQSMDLSTLGGWLACRSAGQYSTRYGKVEDMVLGLEVVLADGKILFTEGRGPRAATGPNLTQLFVGSEGTLGVITSARLRIHPRPPAEGRRAFGLASFAAGLEACRRILRRGATPAVLRLYDSVESDRNFGQAATNVLLVLDEADPGLLRATLAVVDEECRDAGAQVLGEELVERWLAHRNDVSALAPLWQAGVVVDTAEVAGRWSALAPLADEVTGALSALPGTLAASVHQSHAYPDGACLYFTFGGRGPDPAELSWQEAYYRQAWDTVTRITLRHGAAISHHHGIGLNRGRFLAEALGPAHEILALLKRALDPAGILNPGKLGLPSALGAPAWP